ncbi:MAG: DUF2721 domain-containing protein [Planctomycetales bacterium]|nr:DUF2721 domain-containing protein [Planctomycetales bacterium]
MNFERLIPVLQVAIGPVILISGVGLLLLTMTNRFGRVIDRSRELVELVRAGNGERQRSEAQLKILWDRARLLRTAIYLAGASALLAATMVVALFVGALQSLEVATFVGALFVGCLATLCGSLVFFLRDLQRSLHALALELDINNTPRA